MRSNSLDFSSFETMNIPNAHKKTERSHEENQERAYIAASRRTDRSLEARVQSARMASEIHKRRTGKSFRISEEIVMKEEMYEEEDDDLPRSYRILGPNMQTASPDMNYRVEAYLSNKVAMSAMLARTNDEWRQNEVNKLFDQMFPNASFNRQRSTASRSPPAQAQGQHAAFQPPPPPQQVPQSQSPSHSQPHSPPPMPQHYQPMRPQAHHQPESFAATHQFYSPARNAPQHSRTYSSPALGHCPPPTDFSRQDSGIGMPPSPVHYENVSQPDSPIDMGASRSAFTAELPAEARMMMGHAGMTPGYEAGFQNWSAVNSAFDMSGVPRGAGHDEEQVMSPTTEVFDMTNMKWDPMVQQMPPPMDETTWNTFINDNAWASDQ